MFKLYHVSARLFYDLKPEPFQTLTAVSVHAMSLETAIALARIKFTALKPANITIYSAEEE